MADSPGEFKSRCGSVRSRIRGSVVTFVLTTWWPEARVSTSCIIVGHEAVDSYTDDCSKAWNLVEVRILLLCWFPLASCQFDRAPDGPDKSVLSIFGGAIVAMLATVLANLSNRASTRLANAVGCFGNRTSTVCSQCCLELASYTCPC